jgi:hypothetical protein
MEINSQILSLKISRAFRNPLVRQVFSNPMKKQKTKADLIVAAALTDRQLNQPVLDPKLPLEDVLRFWQKHDAELQQVREKLGWIARRIEADPWSDEFVGTLDIRTFEYC